MGCHFSADNIPHSIVDVVLRRNREIRHGPAVFADKVIMLFHRGIVPANSLSEIKFANFALRCEDVKVAVDGTERDTWNLFTNMLVHPFRGRV